MGVDVDPYVCYTQNEKQEEKPVSKRPMPPVRGYSLLLLLFFALALETGGVFIFVWRGFHVEISDSLQRRMKL